MKEAMEVLAEVADRLPGAIVMDNLRDKYPEFNADGGMDYGWFESELRPNFPIQIRTDKNSISFTVQSGPVNKAGVNGCDVSALILAAKLIVEGFNRLVPHGQNLICIAALNGALRALASRTVDRVERMVEGDCDE